MSLTAQSALNILQRLLMVGLILGLLIWGFTSLAVNQSRIACFRVDALEQFLTAYERVEQKSVESLNDLPSFHLVSFNDSFSLKDEDFKRGVMDGYIFDYQNLGKGQYVISASPVGLFSPAVEYGVTEDGILRMNREQVDGDPDTHAEVVAWKKIDRSEQIYSAQSSAYIRN